MLSHYRKYNLHYTEQNSNIGLVYANWYPLLVFLSIYSFPNPPQSRDTELGLYVSERTAPGSKLGNEPDADS